MSILMIYNFKITMVFLMMVFFMMGFFTMAFSEYNRKSMATTSTVWNLY